MTESPVGSLQFFSSPWAPSYDDERRHFDLLRKIKAWPRDSDKTPLDGIQVRTS